MARFVEEAAGATDIELAWLWQSAVLLTLLNTWELR